MDAGCPTAFLSVTLALLSSKSCPTQPGLQHRYSVPIQLRSEIQLQLFVLILAFTML